MATTKTTPRGRARSAKADENNGPDGEEAVNGQEGEAPKEAKVANGGGTGSELLNISDLKDVDQRTDAYRERDGDRGGDRLT